MQIINLFGAPGSGKSATMLGLTYKMKLLGLNVENTPEFFKDLVLEETQNGQFGGQLSILAEQNKRLARLVGKCDFAITDCPLPLIGYYTPQNYIHGFENFLLNTFNQPNYNNKGANYFIIRTHEFEAEKRIHDEGQSRNIEQELLIYLDKFGIDYRTFNSVEQNENDELVDRILLDMIQNRIITPTQLDNNRNIKHKKKKM
jgi:hypothetical protein